MDMGQTQSFSTEDILTLGMRADEARRRTSPQPRVWYQRVHVVRASDAPADVSIPDAASEVRILGTPPTLEEALNVVRSVKKAAGTRVVRGFSLSDLAAGTREGWARGNLHEVLAQFAAAGLADVAELPVDLFDDVSEKVREARKAGLRAERLTVANPVADRRDEIVDRFARCARDVGGVRRVAPLPRNIRDDKPTTGYEDVRMIAIARLALSEIENAPPVLVEVDWTLYGPKLAQVALTFGADFLDAVPATTDESLGKRRETVADVERNIRAAGFEPQEYRAE